MMPVFLDTSGAISLLNEDDQRYDEARQVWQELQTKRVRLVTTSLIFIEIGDGLSRVHLRSLAVRFYERMQASRRIEVVQVGPDLEKRAWDLYRQRMDKEWGMTDCVSMTVMEDRRLKTSFTSDRHFRQAGFDVLLNS
jgi:uncharacterized protein